MLEAIIEKKKEAKFNRDRIGSGILTDLSKDEILNLINEFLESARETFDFLKKKQKEITDRSPDETDKDLMIADQEIAMREIEMYESFISDKYDEEKLKEVLNEIRQKGVDNSKELLKELRINHTGMYNLKLATKIAKGMF
jgi:coenzyme F420-reducing hydrogenase alpha subunit